MIVDVDKVTSVFMEHIVPFEIAKKLKDKEFPQYFYNNLVYMDGNLLNLEESHEYEDGHDVKIVCNAPSLDLVRNWLADEKHVYIQVMTTWEGSRKKMPGSFIAEFDYRNENGTFVTHPVAYEGDDMYHDFPDRYAALEAAIVEALEKI